MMGKIEDWQDIHIAYVVAKYGTLTAAAHVLSIHHSTVLRRINQLEAQLNTRLFHRHARGYQMTEAGQQLLQAGTTIEDTLGHLHHKIVAADTTLSGRLLLTTVSGIVEMLSPACLEFQKQHPKVQLEIILEQRRLRLDHGQAHIAIRAGDKPSDPDYIVQHLCSTTAGLYASDDYIKRMGIPQTKAELSQHHFVSGVAGFNAMVPYFDWVDKQIDAAQICIRVSETAEAARAIYSGLGIGGLQHNIAKQSHRIQPILEEELTWPLDFWLVTHVSVHRTAKVQALCRVFKDYFKSS
ncbi:LysR family transcriptional regulator [Pseudoalteromonas sp. MMG005]|uniref:LysR family transcriptional regulator n=1 Tax=Pseudoalteromonas sp. MMG005 TaxID=2822682 RepID=UPI001B39E9F1|nr:LysR family transcriptional regulator [Pseudoalteromonas sp. MMG005]